MSFGFPSGPQNAWTLGSFRGVPVRLQPSLLYLMVGIAALMAMLAPDEATTAFIGSLGILSMVTLSVLLHELGHAWVALRSGVEVVDITLWPLGGVAMMRDLPDDPGVQGRIAIAGPLVNLGLAVLAWLGWMALRASGFETTDGAFALQRPADIVKTATWVNLFLGLTNLLPGFPMDGARVLQASLARGHGWLTATEITARVGKWLAIALILAGILMGNPLLPLVGLFTLFAGTQEVWRQRLRHASQGTFGFGDLPGFLRRMAQEHAARTGGGGFDPSGFDPSGGGPTGPEERQSRPVVDVQPTPTGGFSDEDVASLESFRGRLQRPGDDT